MAATNCPTTEMSTSDHHKVQLSLCPSALKAFIVPLVCAPLPWEKAPVASLLTTSRLDTAVSMSCIVLSSSPCHGNTPLFALLILSTIASRHYLPRCTVDIGPSTLLTRQLR